MRKPRKMNLDSLYHMDNLLLLPKIPNSLIDLIYCDVLFGTGRDFKLYKDIKADMREVFAFYSPRLWEMHRVLKETGSIYIHCDPRISHWMRLILDEVFGYKNFRNEIVWCYTGPGTSLQKQFPKQHDIIYWYSKSRKVWIFKPSRIKIPYTQTFLDRRKRISRKGIMGGGDCATKPKPSELEKYKDGKIPEDFWIDIFGGGGISQKERINFPNQKPKALLKRIILASSNPGDLVADFFCGSGTTLVVAKELGRNYIGCDSSEEAIKISQKRLREIAFQRQFDFGRVRK